MKFYTEDEYLELLDEGAAERYAKRTGREGVNRFNIDKSDIKTVK